MDIVNTYVELGSYRAAGDLCGVDHKTVKRVVQRWRAGSGAEPRITPTRGRNTDCVEDLIWERVRKTRGRITAKRLLPRARAAGYEGSARNFRHAVARVKTRWARSEHRRRPWVPSPGEHLVIDWGEEGPASARRVTQRADGSEHHSSAVLDDRPRGSGKIRKARAPTGGHE